MTSVERGTRKRNTQIFLGAHATVLRSNFAALLFKNVNVTSNLYLDKLMLYLCK